MHRRAADISMLLPHLSMDTSSMISTSSATSQPDRRPLTSKSFTTCGFCQPAGSGARPATFGGACRLQNPRESHGPWPAASAIHSCAPVPVVPTEAGVQRAAANQLSGLAGEGGEGIGGAALLQLLCHVLQQVRFAGASGAGDQHIHARRYVRPAPKECETRGQGQCRARYLAGRRRRRAEWRRRQLWLRCGLLRSPGGMLLGIQRQRPVHLEGRDGLTSPCSQRRDFRLPAIAVRWVLGQGCKCW